MTTVHINTFLNYGMINVNSPTSPTSPLINKQEVQTNKSFTVTPKQSEQPIIDKSSETQCNGNTFQQALALNRWSEPQFFSQSYFEETNPTNANEQNTFFDTMKDWMQKNEYQVLYDSTKDEMTGRMLHSKVIDKKNIMYVLISDSHIFTSYHHPALININTSNNTHHVQLQPTQHFISLCSLETSSITRYTPNNTVTFNLHVSDSSLLIEVVGAFKLYLNGDCYFSDSIKTNYTISNPSSSFETFHHFDKLLVFEWK